MFKFWKHWCEKKENLDILNRDQKALWRQFTRDYGVQNTAKAIGCSYGSITAYLQGRRPVPDRLKLELIKLSGGLFGIEDFY